jgi:hypothetical protein
MVYKDLNEEHNVYQRGYERGHNEGVEGVCELMLSLLNGEKRFNNKDLVKAIKIIEEFSKQRLEDFINDEKVRIYNEN